MGDLSGRTLGHYRIVERLGAGGMGEVYRARDERLDRDVAIKVLPEVVAGDPERMRRFEREAKALAALNHPNIATVFGLEWTEAGSGTGSGTGSDPSLEPQASSPAVFLVMELLEGESLREVISSGRLTVAKAVEYARAIADGLAAAHDKGIIHRDLKPENVFLTTDGRIKILDFGLATLRRPEVAAGTETPTASLETAEGAVMGTVPYMAPEQVRGEVADHRTDLFALGCVLFEMLAGRRPFTGGTSAEVAAAILKEDPAPLPDTIPDALRNVIGRCLEKRPEDRFDSAHDLSLTLGALDIAAAPALQEASFVRRRWPHIVAVAIAAVIAVLFVFPPQGLFERPAEEPTEAEPPRIVVLPFENLGSPEDEYFADGITEELISRLAAVSGLQVISRTSAMYYKGKSLPLKQIGDELDVGYVLEGTIRWDRSGGGHGRVRITPQLIRVEDDTHMWSERYDRVLEDVFDLQDDVAEAVVARMGAVFQNRERVTKQTRPTDNVEAYQAYLRGVQYQWALDDERTQRLAIEMYQRAVEIDPEFALAHARLSLAHSLLFQFRYDFTDARLDLARASAERSLALMPSLPEGHIAFGWYYYIGFRDYGRAREQFENAASLSPGNVDAQYGLAIVLKRQGQWERAAEEYQRIRRVDPLSVPVAVELAVVYRYLRRFQQAVDEARRSIEIFPDRDLGYFLAAWAYVSWEGTTGNARRILNSAPNQESPQISYMSYLFDIFDRRPDLVLARINHYPGDSFSRQEWFVPKDLLLCRCFVALGRPQSAEKSCQSAAELLGREIASRPQDNRLHSALGHAMALIGRAEEAVTAGEQAVEIMPITKDAIEGAYALIELARIHAQVGNPNEALDLIENLMSFPSGLSVGLLKLDPIWDPLRDDPRFQALLEKYDTKPN